MNILFLHIIDAIGYISPNKKPLKKTKNKFGLDFERFYTYPSSSNEVLQKAKMFFEEHFVEKKMTSD